MASTAARERDFLTLSDLTVDEWQALWKRSAALKAARARGEVTHTLAGKSVALVFDKASTRTRVSFEVGVFDLGGHAVVLNAQGSQIARGEPLRDTARVLSGYCHAIMLRTFGQDRVEELARWASIPVVNGLTDQHHPCQIASDLFTVIERFGRVDGLRYAWVGDGNNMANSWINAAYRLGFELTLACPEGYDPDPAILRRAQGEAKVTVVRDPREAVAGAHVVNTDVWASMGQEEEQQERERAFAGFQVDAALMGRASRDAIFLHCLPAHRGEEVAAEVIDGPQSRVWDEAENRLHVQKAIMAALMGGERLA
jgi:ornithine carbamoyltransferase